MEHKISKRCIVIAVCMSVGFVSWITHEIWTNEGIDRIPSYAFIVFPIFVGSLIFGKGRIKGKDGVFLLIVSAISGLLLIGYCALHIPKSNLWGPGRNLILCMAASLQTILSIWELIRYGEKRT